MKSIVIKNKTDKRLKKVIEQLCWDAKPLGKKKTAEELYDEIINKLIDDWKRNLIWDIEHNGAHWDGEKVMREI